MTLDLEPTQVLVAVGGGLCVMLTACWRVMTKLTISQALMQSDIKKALGATAKAESTREKLLLVRQSAKRAHQRIDKLETTIEEKCK